jgi:hypothetical protein
MVPALRIGARIRRPSRFSWDPPDINIRTDARGA